MRRDACGAVEARRVETPAPNQIFIDANDLRFEVTASGEGARLALLLHGFPESAYSWRYQLPMLAQLGYRVWVPNQRGYGGSSRPPNVADYAIETLLEDVAALIDVSGATSVTLIGHDWGAVVAWLFATRRIRPLERLIIMNVPHPALFAERLRDPRQLLRSWYAAFFQIPRIPEAILGVNGAWPIANAIARSAQDRTRFPADVLDVYRRNAAQPGALRAMLNWYRAFGRGGGFARQCRLGFPPIDVPTLMIWGERDVALTKATTYGTSRYVRDLTVRYLPGVSHWVQQEAPEIVNAMLGAFLRGEAVPQAAAAP
ncbi:MAG: alpha/beta hydrolase [Candidatus Velthaea sp.]